MNLLFVGTLPPHTGGSGTANAQILAGLVRRGHRVHALAPITDELADRIDVFAMANPGIDIQRYALDRFFNDPWTPFPERTLQRERVSIGEKLPRLLERIGPDAVIIGRENLAWVASSILAHFPAPILLVAHGALKLLERGGAGPVADGYDLESLRRIDALAVASRHFVEIAHGLGIDRVHNIPNGVDMAVFSPIGKDHGLLRALDLTAKQRIVLHASNMKPIKRIDDIVTAAAMVIRDRPDTCFLMVGDGSERGDMERRCRELGLSEYFRFTGWIDNTLVPPYINLADAVLMCSETENQPMVVLEAQSCAKPVVASDIPGHRQLIVDGYSGVTFPVGDCHAMASAIADLLNDPRRCRALGLHAREAVRAHDTMSVATQYEALLFDIIDRRVGKAV